ncbi:MAG: response regulator [Bacteroidota bacterium]|jgi:CheY-like chemotaxis protein
MEPETLNILLIEDNKDFAKLLQIYLQRSDKGKFNVIWKENYADAIKEIETNKNIHVVVMDYFLPGKNGLEITQELIDKKVNLPIVFLTVNKDFDLALRVMKLGVDDYLVKEEISSPVLPKTILSVIEKHRLKQHLMEVEVSRHRVRAIREVIADVIDDLERPLVEMHEISDDLDRHFGKESQKTYVKIIQDNVKRIMSKLEKLKNLKQDKAIRYIKDIKMIDIS